MSVILQPVLLEVVNIRLRQIILPEQLRVIEAIEDDGNEEIQKDDPEHDLKWNHIQDGGVLSASHSRVFRPVFEVLDFEANEIGGLFAVEIVHDEVPAFAGWDPEECVETCAYILKINVRVKIHLIPHIGVQLNPQDHVDEYHQ